MLLSNFYSAAPHASRHFLEEDLSVESSIPALSSLSCSSVSSVSTSTSNAATASTTSTTTTTVSASASSSLALGQPLKLQNPLPSGCPVAVLGAARFNITHLESEFPVKFACKNKSILYQACEGAVDKTLPESSLDFWRFKLKGSLPRVCPFSAEFSVSVLPGLFDYKENTSDTQHWYLNFADVQLFGYYRGSLLAQDELQVQEHPSLASLRQYLESRKDDLRPLTRDHREQPTPCLVIGALRRCAIDTAPSAKNKAGLYGNAFARAKSEDVLAASTVFKQPTKTNILAIEAPKPSHGSYSMSQITSILSTATAGFMAARVVSCDEKQDCAVSVKIHTGHWGCGAYGGNKPLMAILQNIAARIANVDLVYHAFDAAGVEAVHTGFRILDDIVQKAELKNNAIELTTLLHALFQQNFQWGQSDGN